MFFVFAVTLITSLTVAGVSVRSTRDFLREKINAEIQSTLDATSEQIDGWYEQRHGEMTVFTSSDVLRQVLPRALADGQSSRQDRAVREVNQYLQYLLDDFPQYSALFVVPEQDHDDIAFSVGHAPQLPDAWLSDLAGDDDVHIEPIATLSGTRLQIASAPIMDAAGERLGTLYATIRLSRLSALLDSITVNEFATLAIVDSAGIILASHRITELGNGFGGPLPEPDDTRNAVAFADYENDDHQALVAGLKTLPRFEWLLVYEEPYETAFAPIVSAISRVTIINLAIVAVMCLAAFRIAVSIVRPIEALSDAARRISAGERDVEIPAQEGEDEVAVLSRAFGGMTKMLTRNAAELEKSHATIEETNGSLQQKNEELQEMNEILEQLSITDGLTKLHNHRHFQETLASECKRADRTGEPLSLVLIDIDEFKKWNDRLGHAGGDEILRKMASVLNGNVRETDLLARYGGEEFAILAPDTHLLGAARLGEKLRSDISHAQFLVEPPSERSRVTVSVGVALYSGDRKVFFVDADRALYRAKDAGRDCVMIAGSDGVIGIEEVEGESAPDVES